MKHISLIVPTLALGLATMAAAVDCDHAGNRMQAHGCGFSKDIAGWEAIRGTIRHDSGALLVAVDDNGSLTAHGPCVAVEPGQSFTFAARQRAAADGAYFFAFNILEYPDATCDDSTGVLIAVGAPPTDTWTDLRDTATVSDSTRAVRFEINGSGEPGTKVWFDDLEIVAGAAP